MMISGGISFEVYIGTFNTLIYGIWRREASNVKLNSPEPFGILTRMKIIFTPMI